MINLDCTKKHLTANVLTLVPSDITKETELEERINRFLSTSAEGRDAKIVVLIAESQADPVSYLADLSRLQLLSVCHKMRLAAANGVRGLKRDNLNIIPADSVSSARTALQKHLTALESSSSIGRRSPLMASATASIPAKRLNPQEVEILNSVFPTINDLEVGTRTREGQALIQDFLPADVARDVIDFWEDEWLAQSRRRENDLILQC